MRQRFLLNRLAVGPLLYIAAILGGFIFYAPSTSAATIVVSADIATTTTWTSNNLYVIQGSPHLNAGITLTITSGTVIKFKDNTVILNINGILQANGESGNPIYFTSYKDDSVGGDTNGDGVSSTPAAGNWGGLVINPGASTTIQGAIVRYGGSTYSLSGNVYIDGGTSTITNSQIASSSAYGVYTSGGTVTISSSTLSNNAQYGVYESGSSGNLSITSSTFINNTNAPGSISLTSGVSFNSAGNNATSTAGENGFVIVGSTAANANITFSKDIPYIISGGVLISSGTTLGINHGAVIKFLNSSAYFDVRANGTLNAQGTSTDKIYFTSYKDDSVGGDTNGDGTSTNPATANWGNINVETSASATINNAIIRYGGNLSPNGDVVVYGGSLNIANTQVASSSGPGVAITGGATTINNTELNNNVYGVNLTTSGTVMIANSSIHNNSSYGLNNNIAATSSAYAVDNYWGAALGPHNTSTNPGGTGNAVSGHVSFTPWLSQSPINATTSLSGLAQYKSDGATPIGEGNPTTETTVIFSAVLQSTTSTMEGLEIEVTTSTSFRNIATVSSSLVSPGNTATATFALFPESFSNGNYHWQARAVDSTGAASPWQYFGPSVTSTDFVIDTIPEYTQQTSTYPSATTTATWASHSYDNSGQTIAQEGCGITAAVMDLRYLGITTNVSGTDVNPLTLNNWLASTTNGYLFGGVNWTMIPLYAQTSLGQWTISSTIVAVDGTWNSLSSTVDSYLNESTPDPVILYQANAPNGSGITTHFVVATGFANNAGAATYTLRDPLWYNTKYLNQATGTAWVNNYRNNYDAIITLLPMSGYGGMDMRSLIGNSISNESFSQRALSHVVYAIKFPDSLMVTDSNGRRTGQDPQTGLIYQEIPGSSYIGQQDSRQLIFYQPPADQYKIQIFGKHSGQYELETDIFNGHSSLPTPMYSGNIQSGQVIDYIQNYDPNNLTSSTVIKQ